MTNQLCDICSEHVALWIDTEGIKLCGPCGVRVLRDERRDGTEYLAYPLRSMDGERWFRRYRSNPTYSRR